MNRHPAPKRPFPILVILVLSILVTTLIISPGLTQEQENVEAPRPPEKPTLLIEPGTALKQGTPVIVRLKTSEPLSVQPIATLGTMKGKLFQQPDGTYEGLFGIPVDMKLGGHTLKVTTADGQALAESRIDVVDGRFQRQNIRVSSSTAGLKPIPGEMEAIGALKTNVTPVKFWVKPFVSPTPDCQNSPFGVKRYHNGKYTGDYHKGVDLRSPQGRPIVAINDGVVKIATMQYRLHGGTVGIDHGQGLNSIYIHMSRVNVKPGDKVKKGQVIGHVGSTGFATGPHLHWGLYANGVPVEPGHWIPVKRCY